MRYLTDHDKDIGEYDSEREDARRFDDDDEEIEEPESPCASIAGGLVSVRAGSFDSTYGES